VEGERAGAAADGQAAGHLDKDHACVKLAVTQIIEVTKAAREVVALNDGKVKRVEHGFTKTIFILERNFRREA